MSFDYATDVAFSNTPGGGPPFSYSPVPDADGFDAQVTGVELRPRGIFPGAADPANPPAFSVNFRIRITE